MPKAWIYYIALLLPLVIRLVLVNTLFLNWLWYAGYEEAYYYLSTLSVNPMFQEFAGVWPLTIFVGTVYTYWFMDEDYDAIPKQFLLLPLVYVPFSIIGTTLVNRAFEASMLFTHPIVIIFGGYLYVLPWVLFVWVFCKLHLLVD